MPKTKGAGTNQWGLFSSVIWDKTDRFQMGYIEVLMSLDTEVPLIFTEKQVSYLLVVSWKSR